MNTHLQLATAMHLSLVILGVSLPLPAATDTGEAAVLVRESERRIKSQSEKTSYRMELLDASGQVQQTRGIELHYKRTPAAETSLFKFTSPPVVQGTGLLIADSGQVVNDIWMYLPTTRRIRRIAGAEKSNWFMGTEFTHEDFEDYKPDAYNFRIETADAACGEQQRCHVVSAVPSDAAERDASGYGRKVYWIEKRSMYPVRVDYIDKTGAAVKRLDVRKLVEAGAYWRPKVYEMKNLANGRITRLTTLSREVDVAMDDYFVSQRYLRAD